MLRFITNTTIAICILCSVVYAEGIRQTVVNTGTKETPARVSASSGNYQPGRFSAIVGNQNMTSPVGNLTLFTQSRILKRNHLSIYTIIPSQKTRAMMPGKIKSDPNLKYQCKKKPDISEHSVDPGSLVRVDSTVDPKFVVSVHRRVDPDILINPSPEPKAHHYRLPHTFHYQRPDTLKLRPLKPDTGK